MSLDTHSDPFEEQVLICLMLSGHPQIKTCLQKHEKFGQRVRKAMGLESDLNALFVLLHIICKLKSKVQIPLYFFRVRSGS